MKSWQLFKSASVSLLAMVFIGSSWIGIVEAAQLSLATKPMYLGNTAKPNLVFNMDDSGSMGWNYMPDEANDSNTCKGGNSCREGNPPYYANEYNTIYYNPALTYEPALNWDESSMGDKDSAATSAWTAVPEDAYGIMTSTTTDLTSGWPDYEYCELTTVYSGAAMADGCGSAPCWSKSGTIVTMKLPAVHGLTVGDTVDITDDGGGCSKRLRVNGATVLTTPDTFTFTYDEGGNSSTSGSQDCRVESLGNCIQHGIGTDNPFQYRSPPAGEDPLVHGMPAGAYTNSNNITTNAFFYTIIPMEYCSDADLTVCTASSVPTGAYTYPAPVRFCTSQTDADADAPVSDSTKCRGKRQTSSNTFSRMRYGLFYREDIVPATTHYKNVFVDASGNTLVSTNSTEAGYTIAIDRTGRSDCATPGNCTYAEEMTNFANWYSYYAIRMNSMKTSVGRAFAQLSGDSIRIGYATINTGSQTIDGVSSTGAMVRGVREFTGTDKQNWFTSFYNTNTNGSTPLRQAMESVGDYYSRTDSRGPWGTYPEDASTTELSSAHASCRQSYQLLSSDGYYNGSDPSVGDADGTDGPAISTPSSWANTAVLPYKDTGSTNSLADVAMYYWKNDLRTNLDNIVETSAKDDAFWQHMVTFTLGFGLEGVLDPDTDLPDITSGTLSWPSAGSHQIDDMWHAAVNGRGQFFSVSDPSALVTAIQDVFSDITDRTSSAASVAIDTAVTQTNRAVYQARFYSGDWTGTLKEYPIDLDTGVIGNENWDAQTEISAQNWDTGRYVATWDAVSSPNDGVPFRWANLNTTQQTALNKDSLGTTDSLGSSRVDYVRGDSVSGFRSRSTGVMGDIVHSSPIYVGGPNKSYTSSSYTTFKNTNASRTPAIYVGANDGMLHAIKAADGTELFAYVPNAIIDQLPKLTSTGYTHQYFVDGPVTVEDVQISSAWKTVLVGALGSGGKAVYALDITDPDLSGGTNAAKETDLASKVLWEFTEADLGYVHGEVAIAQMANGDWAAIFGNGYNSTDDGTGTGKATLYIVDISNGSIIKEFNVGSGTSGTPSGMAAPLPVDVNGDTVVDYIYAGDLDGNIWKFDVSSSTTSSWGSAFVQSGVDKPLFTATDASGNSQPITSRVDVGRHPGGSGYMVYFGTGKYLEDADNSSIGQNTQAFYGVWDKDTSDVPFSSHAATVYDRDFLLEQTIDYQFDATATLRAARVTSDNSVTWHYGTGNPTIVSGTPDAHLGWYLDLQNPSNSNANEGERVITNPILIAGRIIFATFLPPEDVCSGGGDSWIMELDADDGSRLDESVWDIDKDTSVDGDDFYDVDGDGIKDYQVSGTGSSVGAVASPTVVSLPGGQRQIKLLSGSTGQIETIHEAPGDIARGRQSWIQLQ